MYKVFGKNCRTAKPFQKVESFNEKDELIEAVNTIWDHWSDTEELDVGYMTDDELAETYEKVSGELCALYEEQGSLYCGDYALYTEKPDERPSMCGFEVYYG